MMAGPEIVEKAGIAGLLVGLGMGLLRFIESMLRRIDAKKQAESAAVEKKHRDALDEIDQSFETGSRIRTELRKLADDYHRRAVSAETEAQRLHGLLLEATRTIATEKRAHDAARHELMLLQQKLGVPLLPPVPLPKKPEGDEP